MEMQAFIHQYTRTDADTKSLHYSQGFTNSDTEIADNKPIQMRVLFSGQGKAEWNMGMAPIPPLIISLNTRTDFKNIT